jgi:hypothetical protein
MGLRGPLPDAAGRRVRGGRTRPRRYAPPAAIQAWATRAQELEALGLRLVEVGAKAALNKTKSDRLQMSPKFDAGLKLLRAASEIWQRLYRVAPDERAPQDGAPAAPDSLDAFRQARGR